MILGLKQKVDNNINQLIREFVGVRYRTHPIAELLRPFILYYNSYVVYDAKQHPKHVSTFRYSMIVARAYVNHPLKTNICKCDIKGVCFKCYQMAIFCIDSQSEHRYLKKKKYGKDLKYLKT